MSAALSRRGLLGAGALVLAFSLRPAAARAREAGPPLPGSLKESPELDAWLRIDASGAVTLFTGKAELGQGVKTALLQIAAEELEVPLGGIALVTADTARTPNEGYTAGSHSMQDSGTAIRHAAAQLRQMLIERAAGRFGWKPSAALPPGRGRGFARYKNLAAYCAVAAEVMVERETGRARPIRVVAAVDSGAVVNPDGLRNQVEGAIIQSTSWTLYKRVDFTPEGVTAVDWSTYPILRFGAVPETVEVHLIDRPDTPFLGAGETGQGPTAAAIGNAVAHATGRRMRDLPMTRERIKAAIGV